MPDNLLMDGAAPPRPDQAVRETGALLHDHMIGIVTLHSSPDPDGWLPFLHILAKSLDEVRAAGGVARLWGPPASATWKSGNRLRRHSPRARGRPGVAVGRHHPRLPQPRFAARLKMRCASCSRSAAIPNGSASSCSRSKRTARRASDRRRRRCSACCGASSTSSREPTRGRLDPLLKNIAQGFGTLSPELLLELLSTEEGRADKAADLVLQVASRMTDATLGGFVANGVIGQGGATTAWRRRSRRSCRRPIGARGCSRSPARRSPNRRSAQTEGFLDLWKNAADMLTSYSDEQFVSEATRASCPGRAPRPSRSSGSRTIRPTASAHG